MGFSSQDREQLFQLIDALSYREGDFTLTSGRKSSHYFNGKQVLLHARGCKLFARWLLDRIAQLDPAPDTIGGLELGAVPIACAVAAMSERELHAFIVRKKQKQHGAGLLIEGRLEPGDRVVVVDDVITTGGSTLQAIHTVEERGATLAGIYCVVDRQEGTNPELLGYAERVPFAAAFTLPEFLALRARAR